MHPSPPLAEPRYAPDADRPVPTETEVVVIGGGVVGVTAALMLAEWGVPVVLCEKGRIAGEQSSRNWGWIRKQGRDLREMPLMLESQALWRRFAERTATDFGLKQNGIAYLARDEQEMAEHEAWFEASRPFQLDSVLMDSAGADEIASQSNRRFVGAILTPSDMHAEPSFAVPAVADLAAETGARIFEHTAVRSLEMTGGTLTGVVTEHGRIACKSVILAGGAWSRVFLENLGASLPQLAIRSQAIATNDAPDFSDRPIGTPDASIRPRRDGGYTVGRTRAARFDIVPAAFTHFRHYLPILRDRWKILKLRFGPEFFGALGHHRWRPDQFSPFEQTRIFDPVPDPGIVRSIMDAAADIYPQLKGVGAKGVWGGMIDVTPDEVPIIGPVEGASGVTVATGLTGHGFGLGPGVGLLAAQLATGREPVVDPTPFSVRRFT